jgi:hypothetical protein
MSGSVSVSFDLAALTEQIRLATLDIAGREPDPALLAARLMDGFDDAKLARPTADQWKAATKEFDKEAWNRMAILVRLFRDTALKDPITQALAGKPGADTFAGFCSGMARLLTVELLQKSPFRVEELARKWAHALGASIQGESAGESKQKMERLDFGGVLKNLQAADADRAARVKKLQEIEARRLKEQQEAYERAGRE